MSDEELRKLPSFQADQIKTLYNKTTSLEKKFEDMPSLFKINNEIQKFRNLEQERWSWTEGQIAKIKEDIKDYKLSIGSLNSNLGLWILKWGITQEVLRDLSTVLHARRIIDDGEIRTIKTRLDSKPKTEKKENISIDINIYKNGLLDDRIAIKGEMFKKDSRGEKETTIRGLGGSSLSKSPMITHSKLPETEPENDEPWECPICHKTVYIGYTVHRHCLDKLIEGFLREIVELYFSLGDDKVEKFKFASLKQEYEGMIK